MASHQGKYDILGDKNHMVYLNNRNLHESHEAPPAGISSNHDREMPWNIIESCPHERLHTYLLIYSQDTRTNPKISQTTHLPWSCRIHWELGGVWSWKARGRSLHFKITKESIKGSNYHTAQWTSIYAYDTVFMTKDQPAFLKVSLLVKSYTIVCVCLCMCV